MTKEQLIKIFNLTEDQFYGREEIGGSLFLHNNNLTSLPDGFNPTVGGSLFLHNNNLTSLPDGFNPTVGGSLSLSNNKLTSLPEGFNPTVGGSLSLYNNNLTSLPEGFNPTVGGDLSLENNKLTSLPEGFNPTVGGSLFLSNNKLTSLPDGFNPTVGGSLYSDLGNRIIGSDVDTNFFWNNNGKRYALIDYIFCEILSEKTNGHKVYLARKIARTETFYIVNEGKFYAHGTDLKQAYSDLKFKINSEKLRNEPITKETIITTQYYRIITGACEMGCKYWMEQNGIKEQQIKAGDLLPLLEQTNAYGLNKFKSLIK